VKELIGVRRLGWRLMVLVLLLTPLVESCRPYRIPNPQGPVVKKTKKTKKKDPDAAEMADGSTGDTSNEPTAKPQKNSYDKNGLIKKPKMKRRRLPKPGERFILGVRIPAWPWIHFNFKKKPKSMSKSGRAKRGGKAKAADPADE
jgi:hypothetical protein